MSTIAAKQKIPESIFGQLRRLRRKMTRWILVHGLGRWLAVVLAVLAFDIFVDRVFRMDFAQRLIMLCAMVLVVAVYFAWRVIRPLMYRAGDDALVFEVESHNRELLGESLISGMQLARQDNLAALGVSEDLTDATIRAGAEKAAQLDFSNVLDRARDLQNRMLLFGGLLGLGLLATGVVNTHFLNTWFNRNILLSNDQWPQGTYLSIVGADEGRLVIPRGADWRQLVEVREDSTVSDVAVTIEIDGPGGRTIHPAKRTGRIQGREHAFVFHNVASPFRFRASGGDDTTDWVEVALVEPPTLAELGLDALPPEYTGIQSVALDGTGPHSMLTGSRLRVRIKSNKPLKSATIKNADREIPMQAAGASETDFEVVLPPNGETLVGGDYEFQLTDNTGLKNIRKSKFSISIKEDRVPKVRADLIGISGMVVPRAILPVSYNAFDEYGLIQLDFEAVWKFEDNEEETETVGFGPFETTAVKGGIQARDVKVFNLEPLGLLPGTSFRFAVTATDNCPGGKGVGKSQEFLLRVVTPEELRADLLRREIEQRRAFEQAYNSQLELTGELQAVAAMDPAGRNPEDFNALRESQLIGLNRDQKLVGTSVNRIATRFEEFLVEVKNNRLDEQENEIAPDQTIEQRFDQGIIGPIRVLDQELISLANRQLDNCRQNVANPDELQQAVQQTVAVQQQILEQMKNILDAMVDSENFQEVVNKLLEIKGGEQRMKNLIKDRTKPDDIFDDDDDTDIFDDDN